MPQQLPSGRPAKKIDWSKAGLGQRTDRAIARELGISVQTVMAARRRRGIPAKSRRRPEYENVDWTRPLLEIAREMGVTVQTVWQRKQVYLRDQARAKQGVQS